MDILTVKNLSKSYDGRPVVDGISFSVKKGEIFGILGPNGAGKTTTLEMVEALRPIEGGTVTLNGIDVASNPQRIKDIIGIQLQATAFYGNLSLTELLQMFASLYGQSVNTKELLDEVQLGEKADSSVDKLSGGQKQRFSIATALVNNPVMLFLDEPTTGLDPQARRNLWELIQQIQKKGITIILTTHYMDEAELLCERVAVMDGGHIIAIDTPTNLVKQLLAKGFKKEAYVEQANLEDVFIDLTGKELRD
jgi:ABC-2 type transport system ATP-binding protein